MAVLAEGLSEFLDQDDLSLLDGVERDEHGNIRLTELDIGKVLKDTVSRKLPALWDQDHDRFQKHWI